MLVVLMALVLSKMESRFSKDGLKIPSEKEVKLLIDSFCEEWKNLRSRGKEDYKMASLWYIINMYSDDSWIEENLERLGIVA